MSEINDGKVKKKNKQFEDIIKTIVIAAVIAGAIWAWEDYFQERVIPKKLGVVKEGQIYRSGQISYVLIENVLKKRNIKMIVDLTAGKIDDRDQDAEKAAADKLGVEIVRFPMGGNGVGSLENYIGAVTSIDRAVKEGKPVLVHCAAGAQRTGGVIATYRMLIEKRDPDFIIKEMEKYGWRDHKNPDLLPFLNETIPLVAEELVDRQIISEVNVQTLSVD